jgi:hypothetical protein
VVDFILMLTHRDRTVSNCLDVFDSLKDLGLKHVGFKDVGVAFDDLQSLNAAIKDAGATSYMEVVSTSPEVSRALWAAGDMGVDRILGGKDWWFASFVRGYVEYFPFSGTPIGHPTILGGTPEEIEADCAAAREAGCPGVDLLAYRSIDQDPVKLIKAARRGLGSDGYLIVAGNVDSPARIEEAADAGADAFTIGSALFDDAFAPGVKGIRGQCEAVLRALGQ